MRHQYEGDDTGKEGLAGVWIQLIAMAIAMGPGCWSLRAGRQINIWASWYCPQTLLHHSAARRPWWRQQNHPPRHLIEVSLYSDYCNHSYSCLPVCTEAFLFMHGNTLPRLGDLMSHVLATLPACKVATYVLSLDMASLCEMQWNHSVKCSHMFDMPKHFGMLPPLPACRSARHRCPLRTLTASSSR